MDEIDRIFEEAFDCGFSGDVAALQKLLSRSGLEETERRRIIAEACCAAFAGKQLEVLRLFAESKFEVEGKNQWLWEGYRRDWPEFVEFMLTLGADVNARIDGETMAFRCAKKGQEGMLRLLIKHGADLSLCDREGSSPLHMAVDDRHVSIVRLILENGVDPNETNREDRATPLHWAARQRVPEDELEAARETVRCLLEHGADPNAQDEDGKTPLHEVAFSGCAPCAEELLRYGAHVDATDLYGYTPLCVASQFGHVRVMQLLLEAGANVHARSRLGDTPIIFGATYADAVRILLKSGADPNDKAPEGRTVLHVAAFDGAEEAVRILLEHGADPRVTDEDGRTPADVARAEGHTACAELLESRCCGSTRRTAQRKKPRRPAYPRGKSDPVLDQAYEYGVSGDVAALGKLLRQTEWDETKRRMIIDDACSGAFAAKRLDVMRLFAESKFQVEDKDQWAWDGCWRHWPEFVEFMLTLGADVNAKRGGRTMAWESAWDEQEKMLRLLIDHGADLSLCDREGTSPLHIAAKEWRVSIVRLILENGVDPNETKRRDRATPLHWTARGPLFGDKDNLEAARETVRCLLEHGADPNAQDQEGRTPLHETAEAGYAPSVEELLRHGAHADAVDLSGFTPLYEASRLGHTRVVQLLIEAGANVRARNALGETPIIAGADHADAVRILLESGAEPNDKDPRGDTALHVAAFFGAEDAVRILLEHGADPRLRDENGRTPADVARFQGHAACAQLLESYY